VEEKIFSLLEQSSLSDKEIRLVTDFFNDYKADFLDHISREDQQVLPYILELEDEIGSTVKAEIVVTDEIDGNFPQYTFMPSGSLGPLMPGRHTIDWTATDLGFNSRTETQTLNVRPSISLALDQRVGEGGTAIVTAHLSGKAPD